MMTEKKCYYLFLFKNDIDVLHKYKYLIVDINRFCLEYKKNERKNENYLVYTKNEEYSILEKILNR